MQEELEAAREMSKVGEHPEQAAFEAIEAEQRLRDAEKSVLLDELAASQERQGALRELLKESPKPICVEQVGGMPCWTDADIDAALSSRPSQPKE